MVKGGQRVCPFSKRIQVLLGEDPRAPAVAHTLQPLAENREEVVGAHRRWPWTSQEETRAVGTWSETLGVQNPEEYVSVGSLLLCGILLQSLPDQYGILFPFSEICTCQGCPS